MKHPGLTVTLLFHGCTLVCGLYNSANDTVNVQRGVSHAGSNFFSKLLAHRDLIVKEGTSVLIECNVNNSQIYNILWYNSKGSLLKDSSTTGNVKFRSLNYNLLSTLSEQIY